MDVSDTTIDGVVHVSVNGDIDMLTATDLREALRQLIDDRCPGLLLVDLGGVGFCDSSGINALLVTHRTANAVGVRLGVVNPSVQVRKVMQITGVLELLTPDRDNVRRDPSDETATPH